MAGKRPLRVLADVANQNRNQRRKNTRKRQRRPQRGSRIGRRISAYKATRLYAKTSVRSNHRRRHDRVLATGKALDKVGSKTATYQRDITACVTPISRPVAYSRGRLTGIRHPQKPSRPYNIHVHFDPPNPSAPQFMDIPTASVPPPLKKVPGYATVRGKSYRKPGTLRRRHGVRKRIAGVLAQSRQCDRRQGYHKVASLCSVSIVDDVAVYKIQHGTARRL